MKRFNAILLPLDGSPEAAKGAGCALWLAASLDASLHVLHAAAQPIPRQEALAHLHILDAKRAHIILHQFSARAEAAVLDAINTYGVDLVVMSARGESASAGLKLSQRLGNIAQAVIEGSPVPVLLLPIRYREVLPWTSMLAAASGDKAADQALEAATQLASMLGLKVTVVHAGDGPGATDTAPLGAYADAAHHEYPRRMQEMIERGVASCTPEECHCINRVMLRQGDPAAVLLEQVRQHAASVLALGWHGALGAGRALVFKRLLEEAECALLLVRRRERSPARLKVGKEMDE
ncbi:universal stress protein [Noviherbaspirillum soli]|uniref:universal stress protein n=1 Tax=Noviherbaspirillum soli TaxID=1064518 RepID=UPI001E3AAE48|nr:universal stress protein [Noviherbaspirillum soli]